MSYQAIRWYSLHRINNRTHRELLVVDGTVAFVGGAGIADWWAFPKDGRRRALARHDGADRRPGRRRAAGRHRRELAGVLRRDSHRPRLLPRSQAIAARRRRSWSRARPSDRATASRVTFQLLIEGADHTVRISTPYFLPDRAFRKALVAMAERGVKITRHRPRARTPISSGCGWPAGGCGDSC